MEGSILCTQALSRRASLTTPQQDDAYTAPDVQDSTNIPNIFENHHVNDAGKKIACLTVDIQKLIKKKATFEDIEDEEKDDTLGNYDSDWYTCEDVDAAAADDD